MVGCLCIYIHKICNYRQPEETGVLCDTISEDELYYQASIGCSKIQYN